MGDTKNRLDAVFKSARALGENPEVPVKEAGKQALQEAKEASRAAGAVNKEKNERKSIIAKRLKTLREERGLSQKAAAESTGINVITLSGYEVGRAEPHMAALVKLADLYGVSLDYIAGRTNDSTVPLGTQTATDEGINKDREEIALLRERLEALEKRYGV